MIDEVIKEMLPTFKRMKKEYLEKAKILEKLIKELEDKNSETYSKLVEYKKVADEIKRLNKELVEKDRRIYKQLKKERKKLSKKYDRTTVEEIIITAKEKLQKKYFESILNKKEELCRKLNEMERELHRKYNIYLISDLLNILYTTRMEEENETDIIEEEAEKIVNKIEIQPYF